MDKNALTGHTPEPWSSIGSTVYQGCHGGFDLRYGPNPEADCRRIVACVNACAGISNEMLADDCFGKMVRDRDSLLAERDELLAALEGLIAIVGDSHGVSGYHLNGDVAEWDEFEEVVNAQDAIAKAKGV